jgi:hypothetical protein
MTIGQQTGDIMNWKDILKNEEKRVPGINYEAGENLARELERRGKENEKRWKDEESRIIYEGRGGRGGEDPREEIKENDPELYQKLESHFVGRNALIGYDGDSKNWEDFHWSEAFLKYGMEDGEYEELSDEVAEFIESLGYTVRMTNAVTHNTYINTVMRNK